VIQIGGRRTGQIVEFCPKLESLNITNCRKLTDVTIDHLIASTPHLSRIKLGSNLNMTLPGIRRLIQEKLDPELAIYY
jgi:hypothetical protein